MTENTQVPETDSAALKRTLLQEFRDELEKLSEELKELKAELNEVNLGDEEKKLMTELNKNILPIFESALKGGEKVEEGKLLTK